MHTTPQARPPDRKDPGAMSIQPQTIQRPAVGPRARYSSHMHLRGWQPPARHPPPSEQGPPAPPPDVKPPRTAVPSRVRSS